MSLSSEIEHFCYSSYAKGAFGTAIIPVQHDKTPLHHDQAKLPIS
jgi:hypothetical protein